MKTFNKNLKMKLLIKEKTKKFIKVLASNLLTKTTNKLLKCF